MQKCELRKVYRQKRASFTHEEVEAMSLQISNFLFGFIQEHQVKLVHTFLPIQKNKEVNTFHLIDKLQESNPETTIVIPKTDFEQISMQSYVLTNDTTIIENKMGIPEPINAELHESKQAIGLIVIPLFVADEQGYRVGYGGGFYDVFLSDISQHTKKVGVSFFSTIPKISDVEAHDIKLDYLVTSNQIIEF